MRTIAFDVDGTLVSVDGKPRPEVIELLKAFQNLGYTVAVWSGGGVDYAKGWVNRLNIENVQVVRKGSFVPELAVDDIDTCALGKSLIWVGPPTPREMEEE